MADYKYSCKVFPPSLLISVVDLPGSPRLIIPVTADRVPVVGNSRLLVVISLNIWGRNPPREVSIPPFLWKGKVTHSFGALCRTRVQSALIRKLDVLGGASIHGRPVFVYVRL